MEHIERKILIADDEPANLNLIKLALRDKYHLLFTTNGLKAIELAESHQPDLILLDVVMPGMDGYETCRNLQANPTTREIPVIFVTSLNEVDDEFKGFAMGAVDYVTKPIQPILLSARVKIHLELKSSRDELIKQNKVMSENIKLREDIELITRHDLKGPLNGIINFPVLIKRKGKLTDEQTELLDRIHSAGQNMLSMINLSLDMYKMEKGIYPFNPIEFDLIPTLEQIFLDNMETTNFKKISIKTIIRNIDGNQSNFRIFGEPLLFYSMLGNIIRNAIEASPDNELVTVTLKKDRTTIIEIFNKGTVPEEVRDKFFDKYVTSNKISGTGLGTYSARLMATTQNGEATMKTSEQTGTIVRFDFH